MQREHFFNSHAHGFEVLQDLGIGEANYADAMHRQRFGASLIVAFPGIAEMRISVELDHEAVSSAIKVGELRSRR